MAALPVPVGLVMDLDHPLLLAVVPVVAAAFLKAAPPAVTEWLTGWFWRRWNNRPAAQRARIAVSIAALADANKKMNDRLTLHLDVEDRTSEAVVAATKVDAETRQGRQDEIDSEFRSVDSRFERVEGRIDAAVAEMTGELGKVHDEMGKTREEMANLAGAVGVLIRQNGGRG